VSHMSGVERIFEKWRRGDGAGSFLL